jgi:flagellar motility protein MotE (MotC chaperone)
MDKKKVLKQMKNAVNKVREKNAVDDVLDSDRIAEMASDSVPSSKQGVMSKKDEDCNCKGEEGCECDDAQMDKAEQVVKSIIDNFKKISNAYMAKKENRCWDGYEPTPGKKAYSEGSCQKKNESGDGISDEPTLHPGQGQVSSETQKKVKNIIDINQKLNARDKKRQEMKNKRLKERKATANKLQSQGIKPKFDMAASENGKKQ